MHQILSPVWKEKKNGEEEEKYGTTFLDDGILEYGFVFVYDVRL